MEFNDNCAQNLPKELEMELIPELKIGWLNGWILLVLLYLIFGFLLLVFPKDVVARLYEYDRSGLNRRQKAFNLIRETLGLACFLLIIFTPLKTEANVFIPGLILFGLGLAGFVVALFNFKHAQTDLPANRGLYKISRHPQVVMLFVSVCGISLTIGSWIVLIVQILASAFGHSRTLAEEQACLEQYGEAYHAYMERVPRYFLFF
jgi:protein-S-isoprenylcysteine O-methyltransferase Ste14